jgi:hypothetical protein
MPNIIIERLLRLYVLINAIFLVYTLSYLALSLIYINLLSEALVNVTQAKVELPQ